MLTAKEPCALCAGVCLLHLSPNDMVKFFFSSWCETGGGVGKGVG